MKAFTLKLVVLLIASILLSTPVFSQEAELGLFEGHDDIGVVQMQGSVVYDTDLHTYLVAGGGENMWFDSDALHFVWKQTSGDVSLAADISWIGTGGNAHRKAGLLIRQSLDPDAAYVDVVVHGDGLTSLQYRETKGGQTHEIQANVSAPFRVSLVKVGETAYMLVASEGEVLHAAGGSFKISLNDPFYIGLGVCAHDNGALEKAIFSNVEIAAERQGTTGRSVLESTLETISIASTDRRVVYHTRGHIEAPNWSRDGAFLLYNSGGRIYKLPAEGGDPILIDTGFATRNNNDHGISPDGTQLVVSDQSQEDGQSLIYTLPIEGGAPHRITEQGPSYWHGWSPDGRTLAYVGRRNDDYDIYTIPVEGGEETRLTTTTGLDDGPDYSPDGEYIYFNSVRTGTMQIWRMKADGSEQEQLTFDEYNDWFPHPSPDGRWLVFLSYDKNVEGYPANQDVMLRLMAVGGSEVRVLAKLFGGQGTINVPSWSPDSGNVAFVSYRLANP